MNTPPTSSQTPKLHDLIKEFHKQGAFAYKYAADFIAYRLGISRATVYNYLK